MRNKKRTKETKKRFRNHISIIVEQTGGVLVALAAILIPQILENLDEVKERGMAFLDGKAALVNLGAVLLFGVIVMFQVFAWAKTYISIEDQAVVIEKNTLNRKKNTIGIRNISNINLEQNLFEMLLGTCKVKLDTNSRSTADSTDVNIVLKKREAQEFQQELTRRMQAAMGMAEIPHAEGSASSPIDTSEIEDYDVRADLADILRHGFFSVNLLSVAVLILGVAGAVDTLAELLDGPDMLKSLAGAAAGVIVAVSIIVSALWDTIKDFVKYYHFRAKRRGDRIYIKYGFLKKVEYTVPVDKIQALKIRQSLIARLGRQYMAEIVNVGMGDDQDEQNSFLVLYLPEKKLQEQLALLLPEFLPALELQTERLPRAVWGAWTVPAGISVLCVLAAAAAGAEYAGERRLLVWAGAAGLILALLLGMLLKYRTDGCAAGREFLKLCRGYFGRNYLAVRYRNIQYAEFHQSFAARLWGIRKGSIHLLASSANTTHAVPYFRGNTDETIRERMISRV